MEYNGSFYVYMTNNIIEYNYAKNATENTYDMVNWTPCAANKAINGKKQFILCFCNDGNFDSAVLVYDDGAEYLYFGGGVPEGKKYVLSIIRIVRISKNITIIVSILHCNKCLLYV